jgi:hypothetical protein
MCGIRTWSAEYSDQLRRASTVVADRNDIAQQALLVFSYGLEYIDKVVCSTAPREDDNAFRLEGAVARLHWRGDAVVERQERLGSGSHVVGGWLKDEGRSTTRAVIERISRHDGVDRVVFAQARGRAFTCLKMAESWATPSQYVRLAFQLSRAAQLGNISHFEHHFGVINFIAFQRFVQYESSAPLKSCRCKTPSSLRLPHSWHPTNNKFYQVVAIGGPHTCSD